MILDLIPEAARACPAIDEGRRQGDALHPHPTTDAARQAELRARAWARSSRGFGHAKLLIVTDGMIINSACSGGLCDALTAGGARFVVFDRITRRADPLIGRGIAFYRENDCDAIVAVGGGSMDSTKAIAIAIANPKPLRSLAGYLKGLQPRRYRSTPCRPPPGRARSHRRGRDRRPRRTLEDRHRRSAARAASWRRWTRR